MKDELGKPFTSQKWDISVKWSVVVVTNSTLHYLGSGNKQRAVLF